MKQLICLFFALTLNAKTEIEKFTITADRVQSNYLNSTHSTQIIEVDEFSGTQSILKLLEEVAGIAAFNQGGFGKMSQISVRGTNSEHVLVLMDGVELNDPMAPTKAFDFSNIDLSSVERIEIVKGSQSVAYGSGALGGVINIITKKHHGESQSQLKSTIGSYGFHSTGFSSGFAVRNIHSHIDINRKSADGYSSANSEDGNAETDGFIQDNVTLRAGKTDDNYTFDVILKQNLSKGEVDLGGGPNQDDPNFTFSSDQLTAKVQLSTSLIENIETQFQLSKSRTHRTSKNDVDEFSSKIVDDFFTGETLKFELQNNSRHGSSLNLTTGLESKIETGLSNKFKTQSATTHALFILSKLKFENFNSSLAIRHDQHSQSQIKKTTLRASAGIPITSLFYLSAAIGSGFKAPSLFQLFDPTYGNTQLRSEEVLSWEISGKVSKSGKSFSVTFFDNDFTNLISNDPLTFKSINLGESRITGIESTLHTNIDSDLVLSGNYTQLLRFVNESQNKNLVRRPQHQWLAKLQYTPTENRHWTVRYKKMGARDDIDASLFTPVVMPAHETVDFSYLYRKNKNTSYRLRIENLFDKKYELIDGFGTSRLAFFASVDLKI